MTKEESRHLLNRLAEVPDKRNLRGKRPEAFIFSLDFMQKNKIKSIE